MLAAFLVSSLMMSAAEIAWTYPTPGDYSDCSVGVGDLDRDGSADLVFATCVGRVQALNAQGKELWHWTIRGNVSIPPTVEDITGDPGLEVLVVNNQGLLVCLDGAHGAPIWQWSLPNKITWGATSIVVSKTGNDGQLLVLVGTDGGEVACLSGQGDLLWTYAGPQGTTSCPAVGDVDGDGKNEIVVGGTIAGAVCLSNTGAEKWTFKKGKHGSSPLLCDLNQDGVNEIILGVGNQIMALDGQARTLWETKVNGEIDAGLSVGDADGDGQIEVYAADLSGSLTCLGANGTIRWKANVEQRARRGPTLADVNGDGTIDILTAGYSGAIHVFDPSGQQQERIPLGGTSNAAPAIVAASGKAPLLVVCPATNGEVRAYGWTDSTGSPAVVWPEYRGNAARTGALAQAGRDARVRIAAEEIGKGYVGNNVFAVEVANPDRQTVSVELSIAYNGRIVSKNSAESTGELVKNEIPYLIMGREPVTIEFACTVSADGAAVSKTLTHRYVKPFVREVKDFEADVKALKTALPKLTDAKGIEERACFYESKIAGYRERATMASAMTDAERLAFSKEFAETLHETDTLRRLAEAAASHAGSGGGTVFVSPANPWAPFGGIDEFVEGRSESPTITVEAFSGEVESAALNVFNLSHLPRTFRVTADDFQSDDAGKHVASPNVVTLREVIDVPTQDRDMSADALPLLNEGQTLIVPAWGARQLWLTLKTPGLAPGKWTTHIHLASLEPDSVPVTAELQVNIWSAALPDKQSLRSCGWGYVDSSILKDQPDAALDDQVEHGTNVFVGSFAPLAEFDKEGNLVGAINFDAHDAYVKRHAPKGIILFGGYQGAMKCPAPTDSPAFARAHVAWLRAWVAHLAELGVGYDGYALYPVDEPGLNEGLVETFLFYSRLAREADPKILVYTDPVERITLDELKQMAPYVDIWCPNRNGFLLDKENEELDFIKSTGKTVWNYECADNAKHLSPLGYYRGQAWLARHHGMSGIGFWSYCTSQDDPWFRPLKTKDYLLIYHGSGVVPSKRWEAVRDGIEDFGMLDALLAAATKAEQEGRAPEAVAMAKKILDEDVATIAAFCDREIIGANEATENRLAEDKRWKLIQSTRRDIAASLERLLPGQQENQK